MPHAPSCRPTDTVCVAAAPPPPPKKHTTTTTASYLQVTAAISNSFGFGGHNSAVVFAPFEA
jgi:3-oxoacyl-[acyl-carrier-protein] synthase II